MSSLHEPKPTGCDYIFFEIVFPYLGKIPSLTPCFFAWIFSSTNSIYPSHQAVFDGGAPWSMTSWAATSDTPKIPQHMIPDTPTSNTF